MIGVHSPAGRYREALAELPLSVRRVERPDGAIAVVRGEAGWVDAAVAAASAGAIAVVIADPAFASASDLRRAAEATGIPMIIERSLLRPDVAEDAVAARTSSSGWMPPRVIVAEVTASRARLTAAMRDAIGWVRILAGEDLSLVAADEGVALVETRAGIAATLTSVTTKRPGSGRIRVQALGEMITDVEVEGRAARLSTASAAGRLIAPVRFESPARLALRRAIAALESATASADLDELVADTDLVERMLTSSA